MAQAHQQENLLSHAVATEAACGLQAAYSPCLTLPSRMIGTGSTPPEALALPLSEGMAKPESKQTDLEQTPALQS